MSAESNFSFTSKINGDLFTVRGDSLDEFHNHLAQVVASLDALITDIGLLQAAGHATPLVNTAALAAAAPAVDAWGTPAVPAAVQQAQALNAMAAAIAPSCAHGPRNPVYKNGKNGPYKAWMCAAPQHAGDKCKPIFLNERDRQAWDSFPVTTLS